VDVVTGVLDDGISSTRKTCPLSGRGHQYSVERSTIICGYAHQVATANR